MSKVYVSYKRVDKDKVLPIVHRMEAEIGFKFWVDLEDIDVDKQFSNVIVNAINKCEIFLFMYSKAYGNINPKDDWTVRKIIFADKKKKRIFFIDIDDYELPDWFLFRFPDQQVIKANDISAIYKLTQDIHKWLRLSQLRDEEAKLHHQAIDLGLPSDTKWSSCNVGATKPEEFGGYYAWGETEVKNYYDWGNYKHYNGESHFFHNLGRDITGTQHDVAHVKWGGNWRMPTIEQIEELIKNCTTEWTELNGVKGCKFTSKINGNSIFFPAAGYRSNIDLYDAGNGYYWSSTQHPSDSFCAYYLYFNSGNKLWSGNFGTRLYGRSVRPVARI